MPPPAGPPPVPPPEPPGAAPPVAIVTDAAVAPPRAVVAPAAALAPPAAQGAPSAPAPPLDVAPPTSVGVGPSQPGPMDTTTTTTHSACIALTTRLVGQALRSPRRAGVRWNTTQDPAGPQVREASVLSCVPGDPGVAKLAGMFPRHGRAGALGRPARCVAQHVPWRHRRMRVRHQARRKAADTVCKATRGVERLCGASVPKVVSRRSATQERAAAGRYAGARSTPSVTRGGSRHRREMRCANVGRPP